MIRQSYSHEKCDDHVDHGRNQNNKSLPMFMKTQFKSKDIKGQTRDTLADRFATEGKSNPMASDAVKGKGVPVTEKCKVAI